MARKHGMSLGCELSYVPLPVVIGEDENGDPVVALENWPFILPHTYVADFAKQSFVFEGLPRKVLVMDGYT